MQTHFSLAQLADPKTAEAETILRRCVHCGFCLATCPTYLELGNELDSPRGRIYLIKDMLENDKPASTEVVDAYRPLPLLPLLHHHVPLRRRLHAPRRSCTGADREDLSVDRSPTGWCAALLARSPALSAALPRWRFGSPGLRALSSRLLKRFGTAGTRLETMLGSRRRSCRRERPSIRSGVSFTPEGERQGPRRAAPRLRAGGARSRRSTIAAMRLLSRFGVEVVFARGRGLLRRARPPHGPRGRRRGGWRAPTSMPGPTRSRARASTPSSSPRRAAARRSRTTASCFRNDRAYAERRRASSALAKDITEYLARRSTCRRAERGAGLIVAYHAACSLQHGQQVTTAPKALLAAGGLRGARRARRPHLLRLGRHLQHAAAGDRRAAARPQGRQHRGHRRRTSIAAGNIGCITQIAPARIVPVVHTVELLDWAYGSEQADFLRRRIGAPHRRRVPCDSRGCRRCRDPYRCTRLSERVGGMTDRVAVGNPRVARVLLDFVNTEALPGTGVRRDEFWTGFDADRRAISRRRTARCLRSATACRPRSTPGIASAAARTSSPANTRRSCSGSATCSRKGRTSPSRPPMSTRKSPSRRAAARRAGDECPLCAERRQCALGQPLRRALRHRRDPR